MPRLRPAPANEVVRVLAQLGFEFLGQEGSHAHYRHSDGRWTTVPMHKAKDVGKGLLRKILKDAGLSVEELEGLRRG